MEEWDQWRADNRRLETMRQITLDAMSFEEEDMETVTGARVSRCHNTKRTKGG